MAPGDSQANIKKKRKTEIAAKEKVKLVKRFKLFKLNYDDVENLSVSLKPFLTELEKERGPDSTPTDDAFRRWIKNVDEGKWTEEMSQKRNRKPKLKKEIRNIVSEDETNSLTDSEYVHGVQEFLTRLPQLPVIAIERCQESDLTEYYDHLWSQPKVMELYSEGEVRSRDYVAGRLKTWCKRWDDNFPFSAFTVRLPDGNNTFLGCMILGLSEEENTAEIAGLLRQEYWRKGFATAGMIHLLAHARELFQDRKKVADGEPFERIVATCHPKNIASQFLLESQGFHQYTPPIRWRADRLYYALTIPPVIRNFTDVP
ncbi:unnamed protein product [Cylindrotheca closterium]|uniref:N-acetyltransferase domain-containing protein n=1 Tax=Cylindrotheca closterium TaxID=2856 RepID=A0AAD2JIG7_9STRA|nr:unnamed protein product [Cylindrotheca closterium]CAJ1953960.1 unnamed protein product [Cylindrotheca closterium]